MTESNTPQTAIRSGMPDDASAFADLAMMAGGGFFELVMGSQARSCLEGMYREPGNHMSWDKAHFATIDGCPAGMLHGLTWRQSRAEKEATYVLYGRHLGFRCLCMAALSVAMPCWVLNPARGQFYVEFLAVYPEFRGRGVGAGLLEHAADLARRASCDSLSLDVDGHNVPAVRLYEKAGFAIARSGTFPPLIDLGLILRMEKGLRTEG